MMQDSSQETWTLRHNLTDRALPIRTLGSFLPGTGEGGAGVHWQGQTWRFEPRDFTIRSSTITRYGASAIPADSTIQDWGITYDQLEPTTTRSSTWPAFPARRATSRARFRRAATRSRGHAPATTR